MPRTSTIIRRTVIPIAACGLVVLATSCSAPPPATAPPSSDSAVSVPATADAVFTDDFDEPRLDPGRWTSPARSDLVSVSDGALTMQVTSDDTTEGVEDGIDAVLPRPYREVTASISVTASTAAGPGGGSISVTEASGRSHQIFFGPSANGLNAGALVCARASCGSYEDYVPPADVVTIAPKEVVPVRVIVTARSLDFFVAERKVGSVPPAGDPALTKLRIGLYGAERESWRATVDSVHATA